MWYATRKNIAHPKAVGMRGLAVNLKKNSPNSLQLLLVGESENLWHMFGRKLKKIKINHHMDDKF